jgi:hypothetical protein
MKKKQGVIQNILKKKYIWIPVLAITLILVILFHFIGNISNLLPINNAPSAWVSACLEAMVTAFITVVLLKAQTTEQTESELKKERFAVLFAKKSETYDAYLNDLVTIANRGSITKEDFMKLVDDLNFKIGMYISDEANEIIAEQLNIIGSNHDTKTIKNCIFNIAHELKNDLQVGL